MCMDIKDSDKHKGLSELQSISKRKFLGCVKGWMRVRVYTFESAACVDALSLLTGWGEHGAETPRGYADYGKQAPLKLFESRFMKAHLDVIAILQGNYICKHPAHSK